MAFFLERTDSYFWPVTVTEAQDGGKHRKYTFEAEFKRVGQARREELGHQLLLQKERVRSGRLEEPGKGGKMVPIKLLTPREMADELLVGWRKIMDREGEGGEEVPFSEALKAQLLEIENVAEAILDAWNESQPGAKVGN